MNRRSLIPLGFVFFISGFSALIYQISWQRLLFIGIGIDLTSVTIIISIFMIGLGFGAYFGGRIADYFEKHILLIFCLFEALIGLFGIFSYSIILNIQEYLIHDNRIKVTLVNFIVLLWPTFMMGATLPLLTCFYNKVIGNIGVAIGILYLVNTAGAAIGSLLSGLYFYQNFTLSQTIILAGILNLSIAVFTYYYYQRVSQKNKLSSDIEFKYIVATKLEDNQLFWSPKKIYLLAFASGFLSLSIEVIWIRFMSFAHQSIPQAFSYTLALFLIGISIGAAIGKKICEKSSNEISVKLIGNYFLLAAFVDIMILLITYQLAVEKSSVVSIENKSKISGIVSIMIVMSAIVRGIIFPLVHHLGTWRLKSGKQVSNVYFSNVVGSSLAPILISFILLDLLSTQQIYLFVCILSIMVGLICLPKQDYKEFRAKLSVISLIALMMSLMIPERLFYTLANYPSTLLENKHGFIQIYHTLDERNDYRDNYIVFGSNVYDGRFNIDLFNNTNRINRAYLLPLLKKDVEEVLVIGLSTGSWVRVLSSMPNIKKMTVIEINPDYEKLIAQYPEVAPLLHDKRIELVVDDGRRWLRKHDQKFDLILMNTTWHWRAYATNLLSQEYLSLLKSRLKPNGIAFYNTTGSIDAYETAQSVFPYVYVYSRMALVALQPITMPSMEQGKSVLANLRWPETRSPVFVDDHQVQKAWDIINEKPLVPYSEFDFEKGWNIKLDRQPEIITDNNMITEYKYGKKLF